MHEPSVWCNSAVFATPRRGGGTHRAPSSFRLKQNCCIMEISEIFCIVGSVDDRIFRKRLKPDRLPRIWTARPTLAAAAPSLYLTGGAASPSSKSQDTGIEGFLDIRVVESAPKETLLEGSEPAEGAGKRASKCRENHAFCQGDGDDSRRPHQIRAELFRRRADETDNAPNAGVVRNRRRICANFDIEVLPALHRSRLQLALQFL
jgi:hypothetical protein